MSTQSDIALIRAVANGINNNKVAKFAYTDAALANDIVAGVDAFDVNAEQNIPNPTKTDYNDKVLTKGIRSQGASYPRMAQNHFFGRMSYNLNKLAQKFLEFLDVNAASIAHNAAEYDPSARYAPGDTCYMIAGTAPLITYTLYQRTSSTPATITGIAPTDTNHWKDAVYRTSGSHKRYVIADLTTGYDTSTWYPVVTDLQAFEAAIGAVKDPVLQVGLEAFCNGTVAGFTNAQRAELAIISKFTGFAASSTDLVISDSVVDQVTGAIGTDSPLAPIGYSKLPLGRQAVIWLKGGSKYALWNSFGATFELHTASYNNGLDPAIAPVGAIPFAPVNGTIRADTIGRLNGVTPGAEGLYLLALTSLSNTTPEMDGVGGAGDSNVPARANHQHPSDTAKANLESPTFTGNPTAPNPAIGDETQRLATAKFVKDSISYYAPAYAADGNVGYNFTNRQFEVSLDGWSAYKDTPGTPAEDPIDGTGGTPVAISLTRIVNDDALVGNGSARITKSAVNGQGEGISYDFTIDTGCLAATAQVFLLYRASQNYVGGDVGIYVYDITNARLIPCSVVEMPATDTLTGSVFWTQFIPSNNSNAYRLIFNIRSQSTAGWTFDIDNIQVGQKQFMTAPAVTPWVDYTTASYVFGSQSPKSFEAGKCPIGAVTTNPTKGTIVEDHAQWMREGEDMLVKFDYKQSSAGSAGSGVYLFPLPVGHTIDLTKNPVNSIVGFGIQSGVTDELSSPSISNLVFVYSSTCLALKYLQTGSSEQYVVSSSYGPLTVAATAMRFSARFSCAQFSVNSTFIGMNEPFYLSNSETVANTNGAASKTKIGIDGSLIPPAMTVATYFDMKLARPMLSNETPQIQVRSKIDGNWIPIEISAIPSLRVKTLSYREGYSFTGSSLTRVNGGISISKVVTGQIRVSFEGATVTNTGDYASWASIIAAADGYDAWRVRIGQAAMGAEVAPTVYMSAVNNASALANVAVIFSTKEDDTHGGYNTATGQYTVPMNGVYAVDAMSTLSSSGGSIAVYKNGSSAKNGCTVFGAGYRATVSVKVKCTKGDVIDIRGNNAIAAIADGYFQITRIGSI